MEQEKHSDSPQFIEVSNEEKYASQDLVTKCDAAEDMACSICLQFPNQPVQCTQCRCHFCADCIEQWKKKQQECPNRCQNAQYGKAHPFFYKSLSALNMKCKNKGCEEEFILELAQSHARECKFQLMRCTFCSLELLRKDIGVHQEECRLGDCDECGLKKVALQQHNCVKALQTLLKESQAQVGKFKISYEMYKTSYDNLKTKVQKDQLENEKYKKENEKYKQVVQELNLKVLQLKEEIEFIKSSHRGSKAIQPMVNATVQCKYKHLMERLTRTPYFLGHAKCDECNIKKISKYCSYFYHCSSCKYDLCPNCAKKQIQS